MSPRVRQEAKLSELETKIQTLVSEGDDDGVGHSEEGAKPGFSAAEGNFSQSRKVAGDVQTDKSDANLERAVNTEISKTMECTGARDVHLSGTSGDKQSTESTKSDSKNAAQMLQTNPKYTSPKSSVRRPLKSGSKISPSSLAQTSSRAVSPLKTSQFVDLADYRKYLPQPPKSRSALQHSASRLAAKEDEKEGKCDR